MKCKLMEIDVITEVIVGEMWRRFRNETDRKQ